MEAHLAAQGGTEPFAELPVPIGLAGMGNENDLGTGLSRQAPYRIRQGRRILHIAAQGHGEVGPLGTPLRGGWLAAPAEKEGIV